MKIDDVVKVWITKYALTQGVWVVEARVANDKGMIAVKAKSARLGALDMHFFKKDYCLSAEAATKQVNEMVDKHKASLEKKLKEIESLRKKALTFEVL